jgi:hypothetical protein
MAAAEAQHQPKGFGQLARRCSGVLEIVQVQLRADLLAGITPFQSRPDVAVGWVKIVERDCQRGL